MKTKTILLFIFSLLIVACGGSEEAEPTPARQTFTIQALDSFAFDPAEISVPSGAPVDITLENAGGLEHNFVLVSDGTDPLTVTEDDALRGIKTETIAGGGSSSISFVAPEAGSYQYVCVVPGHAAGGMVGTLTVTP